MSCLVFDVEANGLLEEANRIHVMAYTYNNEVRYTHRVSVMRRLLKSAKVLIGHNIIRYDIPLLEKLLGIKIKARLIDTLALSWYLNHNRIIHGLDSYGKDYGIPKPKIDNWDSLTKKEYANRCIEDVKINSALWKDLKAKLLFLYEDKKSADRLINYLSFKMDCAREQERSSWKLDVERAQHNYNKLSSLQDEKIAELKLHMPAVRKFVKKSKPKKCYKKDGTLSTIGARWFILLKEHNLPDNYEGEVEVFHCEEEPNPNSHDQIKQWLYSLGWEPESFDYKRDNDTFEERAIPQIRVANSDNEKVLCPSVLKLVDKEPGITVLEGLSVIQHRLSIFKGFLENHKGGWIKAEISGLTNTLRFKHKVLVNLPGVDKPWGEEIRGCLVAPEGMVLCGSDMVSLEETTKKHYMWKYDPDFVTEMSGEGFDAHLDLAKFAGVVSQEEIDAYVGKVEGAKNLKPIRSNYKVTNYSATYGVKPPKLSRTTGLPLKEAKSLLDSFWERNWSLIEITKDTEIKRYGDEMWLLNPVSKLYYSLRYEKDIFSTLNQGTGVFCFDTWINEFRKLRKQLTAQFHDEIISCIPEGREKQYKGLLEKAMINTNDKLKLNVVLGIDVQFGKTYAEIH